MYPEKEQLEMLIRLQSVIKANMKNWEIGDRVCIKDSTWSDKTSVVIYTYNCHDDNFVRLSRHGDYDVDDERIIRLPLIIDPVNPQRGLCGMLDWRKWSFSWKEIAVIFDEYHNVIFTEDTMATGMLKALCAQEGV